MAVFEGLSDKLQQTLQKFKGKSRVTEKDVKRNDERNQTCSS